MGDEGVGKAASGENLSDDKGQEAFHLAQFLHQYNLEVALRITGDALANVLPALQEDQRRYQSRRYWRLKRSRIRRTSRSNKLISPDGTLIQRSVYHASRKEEDTEGNEGHKSEGNNSGACYIITSNDRLIWYVKLLVSNAIEINIPYVALGLGSYLYRYRYRDVWQLYTDIEDRDSYGQVNKLIRYWIDSRFPGLIFKTKGIYTLRGRRPSQNEIELVEEALKRFTPWETEHLPCLASYKDKGRMRADIDAWTHVHALIDPSCAGLERLVSGANYRRGSDLMVPYFSQDDSRTNGTDQGYEKQRFSPVDLSKEQLADIRKQMANAQHRRRQYRSGTLKAFVDGRESAQCYPRKDAGSVELHVPLYASFVEVYGVDAEGECLLAMFPLYGLEIGDGIRVKLEGGQKILLDVLEAEQMDDATEQLRIQLTYQDTAFASPGMVLQNLSEWWNQSLSWLQTRWVPVSSTALILVLLLSSSWLGTFNVDRLGEERGSKSQPQQARFELKFNEQATQIEKSVLVEKIDGTIVRNVIDEGPDIVTVESSLAVETVLMILGKERQILEDYELIQP